MKKISIEKKSIVLVGVIFTVLALVIILLHAIYMQDRAPKHGLYFIDNQGNIVSKDYCNVRVFKDGISKYFDEGDTKNGYYMNADFKTLGNKKYNSDYVLQSVYNGEPIFTVMESGCIEILDKDMNMISSIPYNTAEVKWLDHIVSKIGANGLFSIRDSQSGKWGYMDINGNMVIEPKYNRAEAFNDDNVAVVYDSAKDAYGIIDSEGNYKIEPSFHSMELCGNGMAFVAENEKDAYQFINLEGERLTDKKYSDNIGYTDCDSQFFDGYIAVLDRKEKVFGFLDENLNYLVEPKYDEVCNFSHGMAVVKNKDGLYGYIDKTGTEVIPCQYESVTFFGDYDLAAVKVNGKWGMIKKDGSYYIEPTLSYIEPFSCGYSLISLDKGQKVNICK